MNKKIVIYAAACSVLFVMASYNSIQAQSLSSDILQSKTALADSSIFRSIDEKSFSNTGSLIYVGIANNAPAFDYETVKAIQKRTSQAIDSLRVRLHDRKVFYNRDGNEAGYYSNYDISFRTGPFRFNVDNIRETGLLELKNGKWEILQQHASVPVTNDIWPAYLEKPAACTPVMQKFSTDELLEDFDLLCLALEEAHAGLYTYMSPGSFRELTGSIRRQLNKPMPEIEFFQIISKIASAVKCGHTRISLSEQTEKYLEVQNIYFPFRLIFIKGRAYVLKNAFGKIIEPGSEILAVNKMPVGEIVSSIFSCQGTDGGIVTAKYKRLDDDFHNLYCWFVEQAGDFTVRYIPYGENKEREVLVKAVTGKDCARMFDEPGAAAAPLLELKTDSDLKAALLTIRKFVSSEINEHYGSFRQFADSAFRLINGSNLKDLIIDLRDNGGGDIAGELIPYLVDQPVKYFRTIDAPKTRYSFLEYTDKNVFFNNINPGLWKKYRNENGRYELAGNYNEEIMPSPDVYNGNLYILINGNSFSGAAEIAALLQDRKRALFFGEETGGSCHGSSSGDYINMTLPHSRIKVVIPVRNYVLNVNPDVNWGRGIIPDYEIPGTIEDILQGKDTALNFVNSYIKNRK